MGCRRKKLFCKSIIFALKNTGSCCVCHGEGRVRRGGGKGIRGKDGMGDTGNAMKASGRGKACFSHYGKRSRRVQVREKGGGGCWAVASIQRPPVSSEEKQKHRSSMSANKGRSGRGFHRS